MAFDINFNALQPLDVAGSYYRGKQMGAELQDREDKKRSDEIVRQAYSMFEQDPEGASRLLMQVDPKAAMELKANWAEQQAAQQRKEILGAYAQGDPNAQRQAIQAGDLELAQQIGAMTKEQQAAARQQAEQFASIGYALKEHPYEERKAILQQIAPELAQQGYDPQQIAGFDPTDQNIGAAVAQAMSLKDMLSREQDAAEMAFKREQFGETRRHNKATEGIAYGNLSLGRERHRATAAGQGGYGMGQSPQYVDPNEF